MKKKYLIIGSLAFFQFFAKAQTVQPVAPEKINKAEIELVYNHYIQNGNNSAVTGGIGTEELTVYGPSLGIKKTVGKNSLSLKLGADVISSVSTDNIDYVISSASKLDARSFANITYQRNMPEQNMEVFAGVGFSIESDYLSLGYKAGIAKQSKDNMGTFSAQFQYFDDDLRWGRLNTYVDELRLVYPSELRYKEWYDDYKRRSYNLKLGYQQVLDKRTVVGLYPELTYQKGLLATPFHRIYFDDGSQGVEQLPGERYKLGLALKLNKFVGGNIILKNTINGYVDNFGVRAFSVENETVIKATAFVSLLPNVRFYTQKGSRYFSPYGEHATSENYYTSDYDFADIQTYQVGMGVRYSPIQYFGKRVKFNSMLVRYSLMYRSNGLTAHIISLAFQSVVTGKKK